MEALTADPDDWSDWNNVVRAIADAKPRFARGTFAYSPAGFGWILGELVQRISGETLQEFLLARLPSELSGIRFVDPTQSPNVARSYWLGPDSFVLAGHNIAADFESVNNELTCVTACVPGAGLLATARELAQFYDLLVRGGCGLLRPETLAKYVTKQRFGFERQMRVPLTLGRGFALGSRGPHSYGWFNTSPCFGHAGGFGVVAFADPRNRAAVAIVTNGHRGFVDTSMAPARSRTRSRTTGASSSTRASALESARATTVPFIGVTRGSTACSAASTPRHCPAKHQRGRRCWTVSPRPMGGTATSCVRFLQAPTHCRMRRSSSI